MKKLLKLTGILCISLLIAFLLSFGIKGQSNNPNYYGQTKNTEVGGPFEASNNTSRYVLTETIVTNGSFTFDSRQTRFAAPDVVIYQGKAFSIFTPGVSFVGIPFYYVGTWLSIPQIATYMATILFALLNATLIYVIARNLGATRLASFVSFCLFLFGTNALPYIFSFTQHHYSLSIILLAILNAISKRTVYSNILLGVLFGAGLLFDIPNVIMLLPVGLYVAAKHFELSYTSEKIKIRVKTSLLWIIGGALPLLLLFAVYNHQITGSYTKIGQLLGRADFSEKVVEKPIQKNIYDQKLPFNPRNEVEGLYTLLISNERSWLWYCPVVLFGFLGMYIGYKKRETRILSVLLGSVVATNIVIYSMFGDPWGGWAFGPRYLIPSVGILSAFIALTLDRYRKRVLFGIIFLSLLGYSLYISTLGMVTTSTIPPKQEAVALNNPIPYTYEYNQKLAQANSTKSYIYNTYLKEMIDVNQFVLIYAGTVFILLATPFAILWVRDRNKRIWI